MKTGTPVKVGDDLYALIETPDGPKLFPISPPEDRSGGARGASGPGRTPGGASWGSAKSAKKENEKAEEESDA